MRLLDTIEYLFRVPKMFVDWTRSICILRGAKDSDGEYFPGQDLFGMLRRDYYVAKQVEEGIK